MKMEMLKKLKSLKGGKDCEMDPMEKDAKKSVLSSLRSEAMGAMKEPLQGLKKVSVAADSPEGLKSGLEKAEEIVEGQAGGFGEIADDGEDREPENDMEGEEMSEEQIDELLASLQAKKEALKAKKA